MVGKIVSRQHAAQESLRQMVIHCSASGLDRLNGTYRISLLIVKLG